VFVLAALYLPAILFKIVMQEQTKENTEQPGKAGQSEPTPTAPTPPFPPPGKKRGRSLRIKLPNQKGGANE